MTLLHNDTLLAIAEMLKKFPDGFLVPDHIGIAVKNPKQSQVYWHMEGYVTIRESETVFLVRADVHGLVELIPETMDPHIAYRTPDLKAILRYMEGHTNIFAISGDISEKKGVKYAHFRHLTTGQIIQFVERQALVVPEDKKLRKERSYERSMIDT